MSISSINFYTLISCKVNVTIINKSIHFVILLVGKLKDGKTRPGVSTHRCEMKISPFIAVGIIS